MRNIPEGQVSDLWVGNRKTGESQETKLVFRYREQLREVPLFGGIHVKFMGQIILSLSGMKLHAFRYREV